MQSLLFTFESLEELSIIENKFSRSNFILHSISFTLNYSTELGQKMIWYFILNGIRMNRSFSQNLIETK